MNMKINMVTQNS